MQKEKKQGSHLAHIWGAEAAAMGGTLEVMKRENSKPPLLVYIARVCVDL